MKVRWAGLCLTITISFCGFSKMFMNRVEVTARITERATSGPPLGEGLWGAAASSGSGTATHRPSLCVVCRAVASSGVAVPFP